MRSHTWTWLLLCPLALALVTGCNQEGDYQEYNESEEHAHDDEAHHDHGHHEGPHGGHVIELTDDHSVHGEFVIADGKGILYLLGGDLKTPVMADAVNFNQGEHAEVEVDTVMTQVDPVDGKASVFEVDVTALPSDDIEKVEGHFHVFSDGKEMMGKLSHDHGHDDHDHGHDHDHGEHDHDDHKAESGSAAGK
ncbi:hypothetical protein [Calycomorphotria hydatis]|uniref:Uncharacterized protein n=1 Tax=Calycomorphotria hydatis TaxID=2528027 RepID=A0A517TE98_9PLAN|nr:hypothetical protein [Calycomorphotria hydatis]QDT66698.1 hypothetical protein V22_39690 [Calycomorphotria hydatis]